MPSQKQAKPAPLTAPVLLGADADYVLPDLAVESGGTALAPGEARSATLEVRYLDTADLRLLRAGASLSRRSLVRGGAADDEPLTAALGAEPGWVLELPRAGRGTSSVRLPLRGPSAAAPRQLSSLVRATVRTGRLVTVARLRTELLLVPLSLAPAEGERVEVLEVLSRSSRATVPLAAERPDPPPEGQPDSPPDSQPDSPPEAPRGAPAGAVAVTTWRELEVRPVEAEVPLKAKQLGALTEQVLTALAAAGADPLDEGAASTATAQLRRLLGPAAPPAAAPVAGGSAVPRRAREGRGGGPGRLALGSPAGEVVQQAVRVQLGELVAADRSVRSDDPDAAAALLTAASRLRGALWLAGSTTDPGSSEELERELAWLEGLLHAAGSARAVAAELEALLAAQPADQVLGPVSARLAAALDRDGQTSAAAVVAALGDARYFSLLDDLERWDAVPPATSQAGSPAKEVLLRRAAKAHWRLVDDVDAVDGAHDQARRDVLLDRVRRSAANAAALGEVLEPVVGEEAERYAAAVGDVRAALTRLDVTTRSRALLRQLGVQAHLAGENGYTYGRLHSFEEVRGDHAEELFEQAWEQASRPRRRRWLG